MRYHKGDCVFIQLTPDGMLHAGKILKFSQKKKYSVKFISDGHLVHSISSSQLFKRGVDDTREIIPFSDLPVDSIDQETIGNDDKKEDINLDENLEEEMKEEDEEEIIEEERRVYTQKEVDDMMLDWYFKQFEGELESMEGGNDLEKVDENQIENENMMDIAEEMEERSDMNVIIQELGNIHSLLSSQNENMIMASNFSLGSEKIGSIKHKKKKRRKRRIKKLKQLNLDTISLDNSDSRKKMDDDMATTPISSSSSSSSTPKMGGNTNKGGGGRGVVKLDLSSTSFEELNIVTENNDENDQIDIDQLSNIEYNSNELSKNKEDHKEISKVGDQENNQDQLPISPQFETVHGLHEMRKRTIDIMSSSSPTSKSNEDNNNDYTDQHDNNLPNKSQSSKMKKLKSPTKADKFANQFHRMDVQYLDDALTSEDETDYGNESLSEEEDDEEDDEGDINSREEVEMTRENQPIQHQF